MLNFNDLLHKWNKTWEEQGTYQVKEDTEKPKYYVLDMFPYPSGAGLHVGHPLGYIASDIYSRFKRMKGFNVLHPIGFDAFGLPAEQYALQTGIHPAISTQKNIERYCEQLKLLGFSFDWSRMIKTCDPNYYKWTQWIFSQLYHSYYDASLNEARPIDELVSTFEKEGTTSVNAYTSSKEKFDQHQWSTFTKSKKEEVLMHYRLAYRKIGYVNWCEELGTVLANDQVKDGLSERGGYPVEKRAMTQWYLRITAYADRLLKGLDQIDWSESLKAIQTNWIGKSEGCTVFFEIDDTDEKLEIYTTRADTIFGATFMVLAPEHPLILQITTAPQKNKIDQYTQYVLSKSETERKAEKNVTGEFTGAYAIHPFNGNKIPIWISEYVLIDYGTGAIMAVPSDDERDMAFAKKFNIPIIDVVDKSAYPKASLADKLGRIINSDFLNDLEVKDAIKMAHNKITELGIGFVTINYKLRDANFSRQRYWGEPFPIIYRPNGDIETLDLSQLPVILPDTANFSPGKGGKSPLSRLEDWATLPDGTTKETDTMPAVAGSSWYYLRYMDPHNNNSFADKTKIDYWQDVDLYIGGAEHAVAHLMYARFWHKFLYDKKLVPTKEPFKKLINQGMIQGTIESIYLQKDKENGMNRFVPLEVVQKESNKQWAKIPVFVDFVKNYGKEDESCLDKKGLMAFLDWRKEYKNRTIFDNGISQCSDENIPDDFFLNTHSEVGKMSKSLFNVINPDEVIERYGTDCFRMYEMFLGPLEQSKPWDTLGIDGVYRFIKKYIQLFLDENNQLILIDHLPKNNELKILHQTIKNVHNDIQRFSFNTCISHFMICVNELKKINSNNKTVLSTLNRLLAPFAPYITEELWARLGNQTSIHLESYPIFDEKYLKESNIEYPICFNGKKRGTHTFDASLSKDELESEVKSLDLFEKWTADKTVRKIIVVPKKMINVVIS